MIQFECLYWHSRGTIWSCLQPPRNAWLGWGICGSSNMIVATGIQTSELIKVFVTTFKAAAPTSGFCSRTQNWGCSNKRNDSNNNVRWHCIFMEVTLSIFVIQNVSSSMFFAKSIIRKGVYLILAIRMGNLMRIARDLVEELATNSMAQLGRPNHPQCKVLDC